MSTATPTIQDLPQPKIDEAAYNDLMEKSRAEYPQVSEWILHVAVTDYLMKKKKGYRKDHKMVNELQQNYFRETTFNGLEIKNVDE